VFQSDYRGSVPCISAKPAEFREIPMANTRFNASLLFSTVALGVVCMTSAAHAVASAEMYTSKSYLYGRITARIQFAAGDGVIGAFFQWKDGSEKSGTFWNELDIEKVGADCHLETNAYFGNPAGVHVQKPTLPVDMCGSFHTYTYEWTPDYIAWFVDGSEIRRETGDTAAAYSQNATAGMQVRFNIWPGDSSFGGTFSPSILPVHQYINWVEYSSYADGAFNLEWREDFNVDSLPAGWLSGNWGSPKNLSTHSAANVNFVKGFAVLSLTADNAFGAAGANPVDDGSTPGAGGATSAGGSSAGNNSSVGGATVTPTTANGSDDGGCNLGISPKHPRASLAVLLAAMIGLGLRQLRPKRRP
jgi:endo-1,3-1,4-beta-glycanase ExoK